MNDNERYKQQLVRSTELYRQQLVRAQSLIETQKLSIKFLQDELGEEAELDSEETQMRNIRRECETRVSQYDDRMVQLQSDMRQTSRTTSLGF
jgi:hypothetical protein